MPSSTSRRASHERRRLLALWTGVVAGPIVWLLLLEAHYVLSYVACESRRTWFLHAATALAIAVVAGAGVRAWRARLDDPLEPDAPAPPLGEETARQRVRWLVAAAVVLSAWFAVLIAALEIPVLVLRVCD